MSTVSSTQAATYPSSAEGYIMLDVQHHGEAWYLDPATKGRQYLADGNAAYSALRQFGIGVGTTDLTKIPIGIADSIQGADVDTDGDGLPDQLEDALGTNKTVADTDNDGYPDGVEVRGGFNPNGAGKLPVDTALVGRLKGKILLQVQGHGEAWYVYPKDNKRYYLRNGQAAYDIMRKLGLGATSDAISGAPVSPMQVDCGSDVKCFADSTTNGQSARVRKDVRFYPNEGQSTTSDSLLETTLDPKTKFVNFTDTVLADGTVAACPNVDADKLALKVKEWASAVAAGGVSHDGADGQFGFKIDVGPDGSSGGTMAPAYKELDCIGLSHAQAVGRGLASKHAEDAAKGVPATAVGLSDVSSGQPVVSGPVPDAVSCDEDFDCFIAAVAKGAPAKVTHTSAYLDGFQKKTVISEYATSYVNGSLQFMETLRSYKTESTSDAQPSVVQQNLILDGYTRGSLLSYELGVESSHVGIPIVCPNVGVGRLETVLYRWKKGDVASRRFDPVLFQDEATVKGTDYEYLSQDCTISTKVTPHYDLASTDCGSDLGCLALASFVGYPATYAKTENDHKGQQHVVTVAISAPISKDRFLVNYSLKGPSVTDASGTYAVACAYDPRFGPALAALMTLYAGGLTPSVALASPADDASVVFDGIQPVCGKIGSEYDALGQSLRDARQKARDSKRVADVKQVQTALELYFADHNAYPTASSPMVLGARSAQCMGASGLASTCGSSDTTYMGKVPAAPEPIDGACTADQNAYTYSSSDGKSYHLTFCLGGSVGDNAAGPRTADMNGIH